ncbi:hypothetical protein HA466_0072870 [Hirschfeldia incana]|nr:hypothetical protein HA466_0072870 [Hirschfeldia incana]
MVDFKAIHSFIRSHYTRVNPVTTHRSTPSNGVPSQLISRFTSSSKPTTSTNVGLSQLLSSKASTFSFARKVVDKPVKAVSSSFASTFVGLSEGMAKYGFLALSSAIVAFSGLYLRSRFTMRKINTAADILQVMGAPLSGSDLRAYVMSGSERKGLVSVEVKKKKGQYDMKLLAVDIPMASGPDQRLYLIGDEEGYKVGGGLISELRDPVVKAMAATKEFDNLDRIEEEEDAERELQEAERKHREGICNTGSLLHPLRLIMVWIARLGKVTAELLNDDIVLTIYDVLKDDLDT